jgi:hypothetical protein
MVAIPVSVAILNIYCHTAASPHEIHLVVFNPATNTSALSKESEVKQNSLDRQRTSSSLLTVLPNTSKTSTG